MKNMYNISTIIFVFGILLQTSTDLSNSQNLQKSCRAKMIVKKTTKNKTERNGQK